MDEINTQNNINSSSFNSTPITQNSAPKKKMSKKMLTVIITAIIMIIVLTIFYFTKPKMNETYIPTPKEKAESAAQTIEETKLHGLPAEKTQVDIMKFNAQQ